MSDHGLKTDFTESELASVEPKLDCERVEIEKDLLQAMKVDLLSRQRKGVQTYGGKLEMFNGRSALLDAYEEALDLAMYLRQALSEELLLKDIAIVTRTLKSDAAFRVSHEQIVDGLSRRGFAIVNPESRSYTFMSLGGGTPVVIPWNSTQLREQLSTIAIKEAAQKLCMDEVALFLEMFSGRLQEP